MTTTQQAVSRPSSLTDGITSTFAVLGLIDIALAGMICYNALAGVTGDANPITALVMLRQQSES